MNLPSHFRAQRLAKDLSPGDLARLIGYQNVTKGANRIVRFEREGIIKDDLLIKLAGALEIDLTMVENLASQDRRQHIEEWNQWADEPVPMRLVIRWIPGVYSERPMPEEITEAEAAEALACDLAVQLGKKVCLVVNRRTSVWIDEDGVVEKRTEATPFGDVNEPWMQVKGGRRYLLDVVVNSE